MFVCAKQTWFLTSERHCSTLFVIYFMLRKKAKIVNKQTKLLLQMGTKKLQLIAVFAILILHFTIAFLFNVYYD